MTTSLRPKPKLISGVILLMLTMFMYTIYFSDGEVKDTIKKYDVNGYRTNALALETNNDQKTIANAWQWEEAVNTSVEKKTATFTEKSVYSALQRVRLDDQDNVIIDHEALIALNATLDDSRLHLNEQALAELQIIIRQGLPGNAGDDVAKIVADYYRYLEASKEFNIIYETDSSNHQTIENTTEEYEANYRELISLRDLYLGSDTSSKLFSISDANANYMFDMLKIEESKVLSETEKQIKRTEIMDRHAEQTINVSNWNHRHSVFLAAKKHILAASISAQQKQIQLTELTHHHFNTEELAHVRHLRLDKP